MTLLNTEIMEHSISLEVQLHLCRLLLCFDNVKSESLITKAFDSLCFCLRKNSCLPVNYRRLTHVLNSDNSLIRINYFDSNTIQNKMKGYCVVFK